jgi:hypothetical protein
MYIASEQNTNNLVVLRSCKVSLRDIQEVEQIGQGFATVTILVEQRAIKNELKIGAQHRFHSTDWQRSELTDVTAKVVIYEAFVEGRLDAPKHLARAVHDLYFEPKYEEFRSRSIWSLSNAFTSAFKELDPIPQFKATAKLGQFLEGRFPQSF